jgi:hypothetical protein
MKNTVLLLSLMAIGHLAVGQRTQAFVIDSPAQRIPGSLYKTLAFVDAREDSTKMGFVQLGAFNAKALVVARPGFAVQLSELMTSLIDSTAGDGQLLFQLRKCSFAEVTGSFSERGFFYLRAALYAGSGDRFLQTDYIDTLLQIKAMDVTKGLLRGARELVSAFVASSLRKAPMDSMTYTLTELRWPDSVEKTRLRLYTATQYAEGYYKNYAAFSSQIPDGQMKVSAKNGKIKRIEIADSAGKWNKADPRNLYSVVYQGEPFIATHYGYYPLSKNGDDFYYVGKAKVTADPTSQIVSGIMFGMLGSLLSANTTSFFEQKLDHTNGSFIQLREMPDPDGFIR